MSEALIRLCQVHGIVFPIESIVNRASYTCYNYGPRGARLRRYITNEWWKSCSRAQANVHLVENASISATSEKHRDKSAFLSSLSDGMLEHYLPTLTQSRSRLPFGIAQIGRCLPMPSATPHHFIYSSSEQTELVQHFYVPPGESARWLDQLTSTRLQWWAKYAKTPSAFSLQTGSNYGNQTINIDYAAFPWGPSSVESIRHHGNQPLRELQDLYGTSLEGMTSGRLVLPDLVEVCTTVERAMSAFLHDAYQHTDTINNRQQVLRLHPLLTPYYVAIVTEGHVGNPEDLAELTHMIGGEIRDLGISVLDVNDVTPDGTTDMTRYDETGVMWTIILSQSTLQTGIALIRNRDTTIKERISIADLCKRLTYHLRTS